MHHPLFAVASIGVIFVGEFLAQVNGAELGWITPLVNAGGFGVVCWVLRWFMTDQKREMIEMRKTIERQAREMNEQNTAHFYAIQVHKWATEEMRGDAERRVAEAKERAKNLGS